MATRLGLFGGTFDPPHRGHIQAASAAHAILGLDRTLLMVANDPWQKSGSRAVTPAGLRLQMVQAAVAGHPGLEASDIEIRRGGPSVTADTVAEIGRLWPDAEIFVIVGADAALGFASWKRHAEVAATTTLVALTRPGHRPHLSSEWLTVDVPPVDVSSTDVRRRVAEGVDIIGDVDPVVARLISDNGLYRDPRSETEQRAMFRRADS